MIILPIKEKRPTSANTVFVGSYASPNPPSEDFTNTDTVRRHFAW
jgi:hypothetical protein